MFDWIYFLAPNLKQLGGELLTCLEIQTYHIQN